MLQIIERLKQGDREIVDYFTAGEEKWKELLSDIREVGVEALGNACRNLNTTLSVSGGTESSASQ